MAVEMASAPVVAARLAAPYVPPVARDTVLVAHVVDPWVVAAVRVVTTAVLYRHARVSVALVLADGFGGMVPALVVIFETPSSS